MSKDKLANPNRYIRYYNSVEPNSAFTKLNGAFQRGVEEQASINAIVKIKNSSAAEEYSEWEQNHSPKSFLSPVENKNLENDNSTTSQLEKRIQIEFVKECEKLALLPEKELLKLCEQGSERLRTSPTSKTRNDAIRAEIDYMSYLYSRG